MAETPKSITLNGQSQQHQNLQNFTQINNPPIRTEIHASPPRNREREGGVSQMSQLVQTSSGGVMADTPSQMLQQQWMSPRIVEFSH